MDVLTPLQLFTCTLATQFEGFHEDFIDLGNQLEPFNKIIAINSNFTHKALPNYENYLKTPKDPKTKRSGKGYIKQQGDGSCFRSAIEVVVKIEHSGIPKDKVYKVKFYPASGQIQIPGIIFEDFNDGLAVLKEFASFMNQDAQKALDSVKPIILNYKSAVSFNNPNKILDLYAICNHIRESNEEDSPYPLLETHLAFEGSQALTVQFRINEKIQRVSIWRTGKINILGTKSKEIAQNIYNYLNRLILDFVVEKPT